MLRTRSCPQLPSRSLTVQSFFVPLLVFGAAAFSIPAGSREAAPKEETGREMDAAGKTPLIDNENHFH
ncbi:hypothetical protein B8V81_2340 [Paenibacillus pasadenensis]|uniref:Uncharacterized protein n=1 Tax=Paenibacillus pasadenensis TaxID=217090 RepID=A0A2N5N0R4_9BACL|nr:hypothetical protein B8V81_2340 [Paenibacillus pasadenensis]